MNFYLSLLEKRKGPKRKKMGSSDNPVLHDGNSEGLGWPKKNEETPGQSICIKNFSIDAFSLELC
jgi:hypothetical protein